MKPLRRLVAGLLAVAAAVLCVLTGPAVDSVAAPGPAEYPEYWFDRWNVPQLWEDGTRGQGIVIAEIDTGVNADIPMLQGKILPGKDFGEQGGDGRTDRDKTSFGHGTSMASLMVGDTGPADITGLAPDAKILPVAVPLSGTTDASSDDHLSSAIRWAADHGADVITMSLGGARSPDSDSRACRADEQAAVNYALRKGAVLIASGGNRGDKDNAVESPAVCLGVLAVAAVDEQNQVADFSSRHSYLTFAAPGVKIPSVGRDGLGYYGKGTSQAAAIAAGGIALAWSAHPKLTGRQLVARVLATLDDKRDTPSSKVGYGLFDAYAAATADVPADAPNPVYAAVDPFLQRDAAAAKASAAVAAPAPATVRPVPAGRVEIGNASRLLVGRVVLGLVLAGAGVLVLFGLTWLAVHRRRARRSMTGSARRPLPSPAEPPTGPAGGPSGGPADGGVVWHEVHVADDTSALRPAEDPSAT